jgi:hypothetical protein
MSIRDRFHQGLIIGLGETGGIDKRLDHTRIFLLSAAVQMAARALISRADPGLQWEREWVAS